MANPRKTGISMQVLGVKELNGAFAALERGIQEEILMPVLKQGAQRVAEAARRLVPVRLGRLRASITVRPMRQGKGRKARSFGYEVVTGTREQLGIEKGDPYYYPAIVEYGATYNAPKKRSTLKALGGAVGVVDVTKGLRFYAGQPYMRPAADAHATEIRLGIGRRLREQTDRILRQQGAQRTIKGGA